MSSRTHDAHNVRQRRYFERSPKHGMRPADSPYHRRHAAELVRFAALRPGARVLEVGSGMGQYTFLLAEAGLRVEAIDLSPVLLDRLRATGGERLGIATHVGDVADPPSGLIGRFDAVVALFTLHHVYDLGAVFVGMRRILRPGGRVAFLEPNPWNPLYYIQIGVTPGMSWSGERGIVRMRRRRVNEAMAAHGFHRIGWRTLGFFPPFVANLPGARIVEAALEAVPGLEPVLPFQLFRAQRR